MVVKSALGSSVEEASGISPADSSVSQSHSPLTHQTIYNDRNEDAEMRVSMKGGSLDGVRGGAVRGAVASGSMRHNHHHGQMVMPARPSNSSSLTRRAAAAGHHHRLQ